MIGTNETPIVYVKTGNNGAELWVKQANGNNDQKWGEVTSAGVILNQVNVAIGDAGFPRGADGKAIIG